VELIAASAALQTPSSFSGATEAIAIVVLLTEFAMLRAPLSRSQVRLYAVQSMAVSALTVFVAATRHQADLYVLAGLSFTLKVVIVPAVVLIAIAVSVIGFFVVGSLHIRSSSLPSTTLGTAAAVVLVAFLLVILRSDVVSQAVGFFALENGVSLAALALAPGLPLMVETAFLFDLLVAVVVIGILMRVHHGRTQTLSTDVIERLRG
jgi:hydrogenase-4 component E